MHGFSNFDRWPNGIFIVSSDPAAVVGGAP
jgi:uncharacterized protein YigE (DUF2233 family)